MTRYVIEAYAQGEAGSLRAFAAAIAQELGRLAALTPADETLIELSLPQVAGTIRVRLARPGETTPPTEWREEE